MSILDELTKLQPICRKMYDKIQEGDDTKNPKEFWDSGLKRMVKCYVDKCLGLWVESDEELKKRVSEHMRKDR